MRSAAPKLLIAVAAAASLTLVFADSVAPNSPTAQDRRLPYAPPTKIRFVDADGRFHLRPFVYPLVSAEDGSYRDDHANAAPLRFWVRGDPYNVGPLRFERHLFGVEGPGRLLLFGTDALGRDVFARWLHGGRVSLAAGVVATAGALLLALLIGCAAGYAGGWLDGALSRAGEVASALPWMYLLLGVRAVLPLRVTPLESFVLVTLILACVGWIRPARLVRTVALQHRHAAFVEAAQSLGAGHLHVIVRHILPATRGVLLTHAAILLPEFVLAEVALSFLGLGMAEPMPTWGGLIAELQRPYVLAACWWMALPALGCIVLFTVCYRVIDNAHTARLAPAGC